jgi:hypothetical protein
MQTKPRPEPTDSPVPGVIPEPWRVQHDLAAGSEPPATLTTSTSLPASPSGRRNPVRVLLAKLLSAIRGDKYMVDAYPPAWHGGGAARTGDRIPRPSDKGDTAVDVASERDGGLVTSRTRER